MEKEELKTKIVDFMKKNEYTTSLNCCRIGYLLSVIANGATDLNNPSYPSILYDTLCEMESEGIVVNDMHIPFGDKHYVEAMNASQWYLK